MALDGTYAGLLASIASWLNRADLTASIPDFVVLAEAQFNRELRVLQMEAFSTGTSSTSANGYGTIGMPSDWLETRTLRVDQPAFGSSGILEYVGEEELDQYLFSGATPNTQTKYTIINGEFQILPAMAAPTAFDLRYYQKIPPLSGAAGNWLYAKSPDVYLYGALTQSAPFLKDDDRLAVWGAIRSKIITDIQYESERAKRPTTRIRTRNATYG